MNKLFLSAAVLSCVACNPIYDELAIDYKYTPEELSIIHESINEWQDVTGSPSAVIYYNDNMVLGDDVFETSDCADDFGMAVMFKVSRDDPGFPDLVDKFSNNVAGVGREGEMILTITESYTNPNWTIKASWFKKIVLHELGHFYGLAHGSGKLMARGTRITCIDEQTVNTYCSLKGDCVGQKSSCTVD